MLYFQRILLLVLVGGFASAPGLSQAGTPSHPLIQTLSSTEPNGDPGASGSFGHSIAVQKTTAMIGNPGSEDGGRVDVFTRSDNTWRLTGTFFPKDGSDGEGFGEIIAYQDDTALISSWHAVYVYKYGKGTNWHRVQKLTPPATDKVTTFADVLQYGCGTAVITASGNSRIAYVYQRRADGTFALTTRLESPFGTSSQAFAASAAVDCSRILIGATGRNGTGLNSGLVFLYRKSAGVWRLSQMLAPLGAIGGEDFGRSVAMAHGSIFVGAPNALPSFVFNESSQGGAVYVFSFNAGSYVQTDRIQPSLAEFDSFTDFGTSLLLTSDRLIVKASVYDEGLPSGYSENLIFTYLRTGSSTQPLGIVLNIPDGGYGMAADCHRLIVGAPADRRCDCGGIAYAYDTGTVE